MLKVYPSPILRQVAKKVDNFGSNELSNLITNMFNIMAEKNGAGLAAPQIGISQRVFVYGFDKNPRYPDEKPIKRGYVINPEILWRSEEKIELEEGCLSFPNLRLKVLRSKTVTFSTFDLNGNRHEKEVDGFLARIIQHETDHLNGVLFPDIAENPPNLSKLKLWNG